MHIGEMASRSGFSKDTLRYYEKIGLIHLTRKQRAENNYRVYDEELLQRLLLIKKLKAIGFTLREIKDLFRMDELDFLTCAGINSMVQSKLEKIEVQLNKLQQQKMRLLGLQKSCQGDCLTAMQNQ